MSDIDQSETADTAAVNPVQSPCKSLCKLTPDGVCEGCFRTSSEISFWVSMGDEQKLQVIDAARHRQRLTKVP